MRDLPGLWLLPVASIPQDGRRNRLIYDFTRSGLNEAVDLLAPSEAMLFGLAFPRLLQAVLSADPAYSPVFMSKVDMSDAYMRVWVRPEDIP